MIDLEAHLGYGLARFLTQAPAHLSCPPGTVVRDLDLEYDARNLIRTWIRDIRHGSVIGGSGQGLLVTGGTIAARRTAAGAIATTAVLAGAQAFSQFPLTGVPFRTISATSFVDALRDSFDSPEVDEPLRSLKGSYEERDKNVLLAVLLELGAEPRIAKSKFAEDQLRALLSLRVERGLPTIVTTKFSSTAITRIYGQDMLEVLDEFLPVPLGRSRA